MALGGPIQAFDPGGGWDLVPLVIAAVALVFLRLLLRVRLTPVVVLVTVLAAPIFRAVADHAGFPRTVALTLAFTAVSAVAIRRPGRGRNPRLDV
jgi:hypothetical protein